MAGYTVSNVPLAALLMTVLLAGFSNAQSPKSLPTARRISTWATVLPLATGSAAILVAPHGVTMIGGIAVGGIGLIYGPSSGHAYAGNTRQFFTGSSVRILATGGVLGGLYMVASTIDESVDNKLDRQILGILVSTVCFSVIIYTIVKDFTDLDESVGAYNWKHPIISIDMQPAYFPRQQAVGLVLNLQLSCL